MSKVDELHTMAQELLANNFRQAVASALSGTNFTGDTLHAIDKDFGYPETLEFSHHWNMYRRFGIAKNVIEYPVNTAWTTHPEIEGFDGELERLLNRMPFWQRLKALDKRQRVGRYAGLFMRVRDGKTPDQPVDTLNGESALADMVPLYESQLEVIKSDSNPNSDTYGQPILLQYRESVEGDRNEDTNNTITIHASRVVFASESADDGWVYGIPALEPIYNSLMDLRKIIGGGAEGFYKNAAQNIVFDLKDGASAISYQDKLDKFNEQYDEFAQNRFRRAMWTPGMDAKTLDSNLVSPKEFFESALNDVAAGAQIPTTILIGKQTGRLASEEDADQYLSTVQSRRENFLTVMVERVLDWCIEHGVLKSVDYEVEWDDLLARSDDEKLANADKMASINEKQFRSGGDVPFSGEEIREAAGFDPEEMEDIGTEELDLDAEED